MPIARHTARCARSAALLAAWLCLCLLMLRNAAAAQGASSVTVPFKLSGMHIYLNASINGVPMTLVLDSGAGANVLTPIGAEKLGLKGAGGSIAVQGAGGAPVRVQAVTLDTVILGDATLRQQSALVVPLPDALRCDGLLGTPFFRKWVITIDYLTKTMVLSPPTTFVPPTGPDTAALPLKVLTETVHIEAAVDGHKGLFRVDTGASDSVTLFAPFVDRLKMRESYPHALKMVTGRGVGGLLYGDMVRLNTLEIGDFQMKGAIVTLSTQTQGAFADPTLAGNIGSDVLQRFKLVFDEPHGLLYLTKNRTFDRPFIGNRSGMAIDYVKGSLIVRTVLPDSPASESGVKEGDVIVEIGGKSTEGVNPAFPREILRGEPGQKVKLKVQTGSEPPRAVVLKLRDLI